MYMKKTRLAALLLCAIILILPLTACGSKPPAATTATPASEVIKIGLITPLTGNVAVYGNAVKEAADLYTKIFNDAGGVNGKMIQLIAYDDKGNPTEAVNAYNKLVSSDNVVAFIGPVTSSPTFGIAELSAKDGIPGITGTATHPDVTSYGDNYFRACFEDPFQGGTMAKFAFDELKATTAAIIYNNTDAYSTGLMEAFTRVAGQVGLEIVITESYGADDVDFSAQLNNIASKSPEVLFIPDYYNATYLIASQARKIGIEAVFLGIDGTDGILEIEGADVSVFDGMYFANHYSADDTSPILQNFLKEYRAEYGTTPNALAALGFDSAMILYDAIKKVDASGITIAANKETRDAIIAAMKATDLQCVTGRITFDANNNPVKDCAIIKVVFSAAENAAKYEFYMSY